MTKKLIALVEVLMVISMFCTGFSAWVIGKAWVKDTSISDKSLANAYTVDNLSMSMHGLALAQSGGGATAQSFSYSTVQIGSADPVNQFNNTTLSILLEVKRNTDGTLKLENRDCATKNLVLVASCKVLGGVNPFVNTTYLTAPSSCKITLVGYPNLYITAGITPGTSLTVTVPLEQIYNLVALDKAAVKDKKDASSYLLVEFEFASTGTVSDNNIQLICGTKAEDDEGNELYGNTYSFTAGLEKKASN